jgi:ABC-type glucose/galactose transport system permease subunit
MIDDYRIYVNNFNVHPFYVQLRFHIIIYGISLLFLLNVVLCILCVCVLGEKEKGTTV